MPQGFTQPATKAEPSAAGPAEDRDGGQGRERRLSRQESVEAVLADVGDANGEISFDEFSNLAV